MLITREMISAINQMHSFIHLLDAHFTLNESIRGGAGKRGQKETNSKVKARQPLIIFHFIFTLMLGDKVWITVLFILKVMDGVEVRFFNVTLGNPLLMELTSCTGVVSC